MNNCLCQTVLFTKIIETFWSTDVTDIRVLAHFTSLCPKLFYIFCKIYFGIFCPKTSNKKNFELYQVFMHTFLCKKMF